MKVRELLHRLADSDLDAEVVVGPGLHVVGHQTRPVESAYSSQVVRIIERGKAAQNINQFVLVLKR